MKKVEKVDIKFGYSCNNNCIHCVIAGHRDRLNREGKKADRTTEEIKKIIKETKEKDANSVVFTGGEVTIRPDFFELLKYAKDLGLHIGLQTNGRMLSSKNFTKKTLAIDPNIAFVIAIHHTKPEIHDRITRVKGSWKQTVQGIKNLRELGAKKINFKVVLSKLNYEDLPNMVEFAKQLGVEDMPVAFPHGMGNALKYWRVVIPRYKNIENYLKKAIDTSDDEVFISYEAVPFCFLQGYEKHVSELNYLVEYMKGKTSELRQIDDPVIDWQKNRISIKKKPEKCKKCKYFNICEGVWEEYLSFFGSEELKPVEGKRIKTLTDLGFTPK